VRAAATTLPAEHRAGPAGVHAHSVPTAADVAAASPRGHRYSRQIAEAARLVAADVGRGTDTTCVAVAVRPPSVPWLEPDVLDHLDALHAKAGAGGAVCDRVRQHHVEVVWDLDNEASARAAEYGMAFDQGGHRGGGSPVRPMVVELSAAHRRRSGARDRHAPTRAPG